MDQTMRVKCLSTLTALVVATGSLPAQALTVDQTNLVADQPGVALTTDSNLVNPWGISFSPTSPFWVSDNGTGLATLYKGSLPQALVVTIPPGTTSAPTGQVFNPTANGFVLANNQKSLFLFATENGTIAGWNGAAGTTASVAVTMPGAVYTGLALGGTTLFAANFKRKD